MLRILSAAMTAALLALPAFAQDGLRVSDAYARISPHAGAVFLVIENLSGQDDRLVAAGTEVAGKAGLHTHVEDENGVMRMREVAEGFAIPAGASFELARGGAHIMLMGLARPLQDGDSFTLTLTFERAGAIPVEVTVDSKRKPAGHGQHGTQIP